MSPYERLRTADFNRDAHPDIVITNLDDGTVTILLGDGHGGFSEAAGSPFATGPAPWEVAITDIDGDGNLDLVVARATFTVRRAPAWPSFAATAPGALRRCRDRRSRSADAAVRTRSRPAILAGPPGATSATVVVLHAQPGGAFKQSVIPNGTGPTWCGVAADLDGDGTDDIVMSNNPEGVVRTSAVRRSEGGRRALHRCENRRFTASMRKLPIHG